MVDRVEQTDRAFLDEVVERHAVIAITTRNTANEAEMTEYQSLPCAVVAATRSANELTLGESDPTVL